MRRRSVFSALIVLLIVAGILYYFYSYHNRDLTSDMSAAKEYAGDSATTSAVKTALALNKQLASFDIHVETTNNTVTLAGQVPGADDKRVAGDIALSTSGVAGVTNDLQVDPRTGPKPQATQAADVPRQDSGDTKAAVLEAIMANPALKTEHIKVDVSGGDVKLSGSVRTQAQKSAAESAAGAVPNVHNVDSRGLTVTK